MLAQGSGRIVTIASMSGAHIVNVPQQQVAYNASKGGIVAMTKSLAYEWAPRGIRVNALSPGYVDTPLLGSKADLHHQWKGATPLRRFAEPRGGRCRGGLAAERRGLVLLWHGAADGRWLLAS